MHNKYICKKLFQMKPENDPQKMTAIIQAKDKQILELELKAKSLSRHIKTSKQADRRYTQRMTNRPNPSIAMATLFNEDQLYVLNNGSINGMEWSPDTIIKSMKTKFACGNKRYQFLRNSGYPLPSTRTLQRKVLGLQFDAGINTQTFEFLRRKMSKLSNEEKQCAIVCDEMSITEGTQYDPNTQAIIGTNTIPLAKATGTVKATQALFLICGTSTRWKYTVGYQYTGDSVNAECFKKYLFDIIRKVEDCGLFVNSFTSDMGGSNKALWKLLNISARRGMPIRNFILHPCNENRRLWIFADVPHGFKNFVQSFLKHEKVQFDQSIVDKYNLSSDSADMTHVHRLFQIQMNNELKMAPKLQGHCLRPSNFEKMKVAVSSNLVHPHVSTALHYLADDLNEPDFKTTAW